MRESQATALRGTYQREPAHLGKLLPKTRRPVASAADHAQEIMRATARRVGKALFIDGKNSPGDLTEPIAVVA